MKPCLSFWTYGGMYAHDLNIPDKSNTILNMYKVCAYLLLRLYGEVHLITDKRGAKFLKDIPFTTVDISLENLPKDMGIIWSAGKIYSYKLLADKKEPFFHLDADVIMTQKLPEDLVNSDVFVQNKEFNVFDAYGVLEFFNLIPNKYFLAEKLSNTSYNMGVFGGKDFEFIKYYSETALRAALDQDNLRAIRNHYFTEYHYPACIFEQYFLTLAAQIKNKNVTTFITIKEELDLIYELMPVIEKRSIPMGYFHLWNAKNDKSKRDFYDKIGAKIFND